KKEKGKTVATPGDVYYSESSKQDFSIENVDDEFVYITKVGSKKLSDKDIISITDFNRYIKEGVFKLKTTDKPKKTKPKTQDNFEPMHKEVQMLGSIDDKDAEYYLTELYKRKLKSKKITTVLDEPLLLNLDNLPVSKAPKLKPVIPSLKNIVSKDNLRISMCGVYVDKDGYVATDAHVLVKLQAKTPKKQHNKILNAFPGRIT